MRIGLVKRSFRLQGGGERQIGYLIAGLLAQGHAVHLFSEQPPPDEPPAGVTYHTVTAVPTPRAFRPLSFALRVRSTLRHAGLTVVQSFDRTLGQQVYRAGEGVHREWLRRKRRSVPALTRTWSQLSLFDRVLVALERRVFCQTPIIITNSERGQDEIQHHYGVPATRLLTIYNGVDTDRFHPGVRQLFRQTQRAVWGVSTTDLVLLFVGSGFHRKGLDRMIEALGELRRRGATNVRLVVVGKGRMAPYQRLARKVAVADVVRFEGLRIDVERCYAAADLFVLPTRYDPFANTCLEAMACGLPVLTTAINGAAELMHDGLHGCVLDDTPSSETVADALQRMLTREQRQAMGEAAQQMASDYPLSRALTQTLQVYEALASESPEAGSARTIAPQARGGCGDRVPPSVDNTRITSQ
jgi:UDP-glucose:(heptosyl)LPS alpha-1,3-glucosyltransferase